MDAKGFTIKDFFFFKKMYTPVFITLFYWLCLFCIVLVGIGILFSSFQSFEMSFGAGLFGIFRNHFYFNKYHFSAFGI